MYDVVCVFDTLKGCMFFVVHDVPFSGSVTHGG